MSFHCMILNCFLSFSYLKKKKKNGNFFSVSSIIDLKNNITKPFNNKQVETQERKHLMDIKKKFLKENLKRYNLFNIYLDKIKGKEVQRKKVRNLNRIEHYDEYVHLFNLEALLYYTHNKFKLWKCQQKYQCQQKGQCQQNQIKFFFRIFIQYNVILNDFFFFKKEEKCNYVFQNIFQPYIKEAYPYKRIKHINYDQDFFIKSWQIVNILSHVDFFRQLKTVDLKLLSNSDTSLKKVIAEGNKNELFKKKKEREREKEKENDNDNNGQTEENKSGLTERNEKSQHVQNAEYGGKTFIKIKKKNENNNINNDNIENIFHTYMTINETESINLNEGPSFIHNVKLIDNTYEIKDVSTYFYFGDNIKNGSLRNKKTTNYNETEQLEVDLKHISLNDYEKNKEYLKLVSGFFFLLTNFIKYVNEDVTVKLFVTSIKLLNDAIQEKQVVISFYKEIYKKLKTMKQISNKNLAYMLVASNSILHEENQALLDYAKEEILKKGRENKHTQCKTKKTKENYFDIYKITPSHLENIIYAFSKNKYKDKELFLLFSRIIKKKFQGFSCIVTINILHSFTILNYEILIFPFLYEKIKSFDLLTFVTCMSRNILKLIQTLILAETHHQKKNFLKIDKSKLLNKKNENKITEQTIYITLFVALLYELNRFKQKALNEHVIRNLYKKCIRLNLFDIKTEKEWKIIKTILKKKYEHFNIAQIEETFFFSFLNKNINKINFHKLIWVLLIYNNYVRKNINTFQKESVKRKFI